MGLQAVDNTDLRGAVADWLRANEQVVADHMRGRWRDSEMILHRDFDALVKAVVIEVSERVRRDFDA